MYSSASPIPAPGNVKEKSTIKIIIANNKGTKTLETLPKPFSKSVWEITHIITHPTSIAIATKGTKVPRPPKVSFA